MKEIKLPEGFSSRKISANGIDQYFITGGKGEPLLLLHGFPQTSYEWFHIMIPLSEKFKVIIPDLRGAGNSDKPKSDSGYSKTLIAKDIYKLLQYLKVDEVNIAGHDIGGMVAYTFAQVYPKMIKKLVFMDFALVGYEPFWSKINSSYDLWHFGFFQKKWALEVFKGNENLLVKNFTEELTYDSKKIDFKSLKIYTNYLKADNGLEGQFNYYKAFPQDTIDNEMYTKTKIQAPTLIISGEKSMGQENAMYSIFKNLVHTEKLQNLIVPEAGHWLIEEQEQIVLSAILKFL